MKVSFLISQYSNLKSDLSIDYSGIGVVSTVITFASGWTEAFILVKMDDTNVRTVSFHVCKVMLPASGKYNLVGGYYYSSADCMSVQLSMNQSGIIAKVITFGGQLLTNDQTLIYVATR